MKIRLLVLTLIFSQTAFSQNFISENKLWHVKDFSWDIVTTQIYKIEGDTIINSMNYKKLWYSYDSAMNEIWLDGFIREQSGVVYLLNYYDNEGVLYDFNLDAGDTAHIVSEFCGEIQIIVTETDTVEYFGVPRKRWILDGWSGDYWIEGIGSNNGLVYTKLYECVADIYKVLTCYHENDTLFYLQEGEVECFQTNVGIEDNQDRNQVLIRPNPVVNGQPFVIQCDAAIRKVEIYNLYGKIAASYTLDSAPEAIIATSNLLPGLYLIKIITEKDKFFSGKLIVR